ncbi:lipopolysaccharide biosynthesis protein [Microbacterium aurantiacum]|uniref:lipopolysaccharide biosynthesis protein n=1 Tax=Microbacterium aurantiacum TaxID=162393 RepID=UPI003F49328D
MKKMMLAATSARVLAAVFQAFFFILGARWLTPAEFGLVNAWIAVAVLISVIIASGIPQFLLKARAEGDEERVGQLLYVSSRATLVVVVAAVSVMFVVVPFLGSWGGLISVCLIAIGAVMDKATETRLSIFIADRKALIPALALISRRAVSFFAVLTLLSTDVQGRLEWFAGCFALGAATGLLTTVMPLRVATVRHMDRRLLRELAPFAIANATAQGRSLDIPIVTLLAGPASGGIYSAAYRLAGPILLVATSVSSVILPESARGSREGARKGLVVLLACTAVAGLASAICGMLCAPIVVWVLGAEYADAAEVLVFMLPAIVMVGATSVLGSVLQGRGRASFVSKNGLVFLLVYLCLLLVGVWMWGAIGAGVALLVSYVFKVSAMLLFAFRNV